MTREQFVDYLSSIGGLTNGDNNILFDVDDFYIGDGWFSLVRQLMDELIIAGWDRELFQVKEKFGGLGFYASSSADSFIIKFYEAKSLDICEVCGEYGSGRIINEWYSTLCDRHCDERTKIKGTD